MSMTLAQRSRHAPAILAYIQDRFRPSQVDSAIYLNCPITSRYTYEIYPEGGLEPAGYYIAINGEVDERDPLRNNIASLDVAKAEIAVRIGLSVAAAEEQLNGYRRIEQQVGIFA